MRDLPGPGLEPVSPALAGGFLTTVPAGESLSRLKKHLKIKKAFKKLWWFWAEFFHSDHQWSTYFCSKGFLTLNPVLS